MAILNIRSGTSAIDFETNMLRYTDIVVGTVRVFYNQRHNDEVVECYDDYPVSPKVIVPVMPTIVKLISDTGEVLVVSDDFENINMAGFILKEGDTVVINLDHIRWA